MEKDAARFRRRNNNTSSNDESCKLCSAPVEDVHHFISVCPILEGERSSLIDRALPTVKAHLPDHVTRLKDFAEIILGTNWVDDCATQHFYIEFLQKLRSFHISRINAGLLSTYGNSPAEVAKKIITIYFVQTRYIYTQVAISNSVM